MNETISANGREQDWLHVLQDFLAIIFRRSWNFTGGERCLCSSRYDPELEESDITVMLNGFKGERIRRRIYRLCAKAR